MLSVQSRLSECQYALTRWSRQKFGNEVDQLKQKTKLLQDLQQKANSELIESIKTLQVEIDEILAREDASWKQHAKQNWYQMGDRNTQLTTDRR